MKKYKSLAHERLQIIIENFKIFHFACICYIRLISDANKNKEICRYTYNKCDLLKKIAFILKHYVINVISCLELSSFPSNFLFIPWTWQSIYAYYEGFVVDDVFEGECLSVRECTIYIRKCLYAHTHLRARKIAWATISVKASPFR